MDDIPHFANPLSLRVDFRASNTTRSPPSVGAFPYTLLHLSHSPEMCVKLLVPSNYSTNDALKYFAFQSYVESKAGKSQA